MPFSVDQPIIPELKTKTMVIIETGCWFLLGLHLVSCQEVFEAHTFLPTQVNIYYTGLRLVIIVARVP